MANTIVPRIERQITKLCVSHENGEIAFAFPAVGLNTYQAIGQEILSKGLKVPTGDYSASLLHTAYCSPQVKDEPEFKNVRELMKSNWLWVFNQNLWTPEGVYVIQDLEAKGKSQSFDISPLEKMLKGSQEISGVRFSEDKKVRFAPKGSYKLGGHTSKSLSEDGFVIASYNVDGAKKLAEVSNTLRNNPVTYGIEVSEGNKSELRISALVEYVDGLRVIGSDWYGDIRGRAFGVL